MTQLFEQSHESGTTYAAQDVHKKPPENYSEIIPKGCCSQIHTYMLYISVQCYIAYWQHETKYLYQILCEMHFKSSLQNLKVIIMVILGGSSCV